MSTPIISSNWQNLQKKQQQQQKKKPTDPSKVRKNNSTNSNGRKVRTPKPEEATKVTTPSEATTIENTTNELPKDEVLKSKRQSEIGKYLAIDCEFVGTGPEGAVSELARVSIVNYYGVTVYDTFVRPTERVTDWRTWVSGVSPKHMKNAIPFKEAQRATANLLDGRILVGHAIEHDLEALMLSHPRSMIRDTSKHGPFRTKYAQGKTPSLKKLTKEILNIDIQSGQHSSVEDAKATMLIYKSDRKEFEKVNNIKFNIHHNKGDK